MKLYLYRGLFLLLLPLLNACEKQMLGPDPETDPFAVHDHLWEDVRDRYSFLAEKNINWDSLGAESRSQLSPDMSEQELFRVLDELLDHLEDGHVNLLAPFDVARNWNWFEDFPANYNAELIETEYLGSDARLMGALTLQHGDSILYVRVADFSGWSDAQLGALVAEANAQRGLVLDLRNNGGGSLQAAFRLGACFIDAPLRYARRRTKIGPGPDAFSAWEDLEISAREGARYIGKVAVLTNRRSYSTSSHFAELALQAPNMRSFGDFTGGGGGTPVYGELPNGWTYRFSGTQSVALDGRQLEAGIAPDTLVALDAALVAAGEDNIIEAAVAWLLE